jgi:ABC-type polysaccharide/polyol phosphate transport system ATPase subunit
MPPTSPSIADQLDEPARSLRELRRPRGPVVIEVRNVNKTFRIPHHRADSFKERAVHPLTRTEYRELHALRDVSFDIHKGEFFGIVGRNGSGKSSLLKIMASIYRADGGRVRTAGLVAPFIELGVGFNPELTARENGVLSGVLMGLTRREARQRLDAMIEFAELEEFADLKLKNYSSGMMVRFAFSVMVQADADIMLIDEVLAVGDAAFAQKCMDVFHEKRDAGKTVVLVTHDMATVQSMCHRAALLHEGELKYIGDPEDTALRYYRLNFADAGADAGRPAGEPEAVMDLNVRVVEATLRDQTGAEITNVEQDLPIEVDLVFEAARELAGPIFVFHVVNEEGVVVFAFTRTLDERVSTGQRIRLRGRLENRLVGGRYFLDCWVRQDEHQSMMALQALRVLRFVVFGTAPRHGVVTLNADIEPVAEP